MNKLEGRGVGLSENLPHLLARPLFFVKTKSCAPFLPLKQGEEFYFMKKKTLVPTFLSHSPENYFFLIQRILNILKKIVFFAVWGGGAHTKHIKKN